MEPRTVQLASEFSVLERRGAVLRGGLDGMAAVVPYGDPALATLRRDILPPPPGEAGGLLDLGGFFGLHPALANLHTLFGRFEPLPVAAGQVVIHQGEVGDYYYLVREGSAQVTRAVSGGTVTLARIEPGEGFGEDALISGEPRNATVTMLSAGLLMRLAASDFHTQLQAPLVHPVTAEEAAAMVHRRGAVLIDVRMEDEYRQGKLKGSLNLPLYLLRLRARALDPARPYILYCQTGRRSSTAAFLLAQRGFDVHVLTGGLDAMKMVHPASNS